MKKKLKIAWLHSHLMYWLGGTKFVYETAKRLKNKAEIKIFVEKVDKKLANKFKKEIGIEIEAVSNISSYSFFYWLFSPFIFKKEINVLKDKLKGYDILLPSMFPMNYFAYKIKKNQKIIQYIYEPYEFFHDRQFINKLPILKRLGSIVLSFFYKKLDIKATKEADKVLTLSNTVNEEIKRIYGVKALVTYEGVDVSFFRKKENKDLKKKYQGYEIIIHSTDYLPIKGTPYVIKALAKVIKVMPKTKLLITSTIENKKEKKKLIKLARKLKVDKKTEFLGFVDYSLLPCYYSLANVLVHAGISKGAGATTMSLPVKEALACQTPVVRSADTKEEVIDGKSGFLVDPKNSDQMAKAIIKILSNKKLAKKMGIFGRKYIEDHFTWDIVVNNFWQAIKKSYDSSN